MQAIVFNFKIGSVTPVRTIGGKGLRQILDLKDIPSSLKPLIRQNVLDKDDLAIFDAIKQRVNVFLSRNGSKDPLLGWLVSDADQIVSFMEAQKSLFEDEKARLLASYEAKKEAHLGTVIDGCRDAGFPHCQLLETLIRDAQPKLEYLEKEIQFDFLRPRKIDILPEEEDKILSGLYGQMLREISAFAEKGLGSKRMSAQRRWASAIKDKCEALEYLDKRYSLIAKQVSGVLQSIPEKESDGEYSPSERMAMLGLLQSLANPEKLDSLSKGDEGLFSMEEGDEDEDGAEAQPQADSESEYNSDEDEDEVEVDVFIDLPEVTTPRPAQEAREYAW